jgi:hypothetical protein
MRKSLGAALTAMAIAAGILAPAAGAGQTWGRCPPGSDNPNYCEHHPHHPHNHHHHDSGSRR